MKINIVTSFAAGMLLATTICGAVYASEPKTQTIPTQGSEKEMVAKLNSNGYLVLSKDKLGKEEKPAPANVNNSDKIVIKAVITVANGMTSFDVGKALVMAKIIPNAFKFSKDVEKKGLENKLRPGVFVVSSDMPYDKVISTIFK